MKRTSKRILAGTAAALLAFSAMGFRYADPVFAVISDSSYIASSTALGGYEAKIGEYLSQTSYTIQDVYGITFFYTVNDPSQGYGGGFITQNNTNSWNSMEWGNSGSGKTITGTDTSVTYLSDAPICSASDSYLHAVLQVWWGDITITGFDVLDAQGNSLTQSPAPTETETEPELGPGISRNEYGYVWVFPDNDIFNYPKSTVSVTYTDDHNGWQNIGFGASQDGWKSVNFTNAAGEHVTMVFTIEEFLSGALVTDPAAVSYASIGAYNGCILENVTVTKVENETPSESENDDPETGDGEDTSTEGKLLPVVDDEPSEGTPPSEDESSSVSPTPADEPETPAEEPAAPTEKEASAPVASSSRGPSNDGGSSSSATSSSQVAQSEALEHSALKYMEAQGQPVVWQSAEDAVTISWGSINKAEKYALFAYDFEKDDLRLLIETTEHSVQIHNLEHDVPYGYLIVPMINGEWAEPRESDLLMFYIYD
ncbi:MAG: hypothetical protein IJ251_09005 [Oscillospiraceae bacterium]|nr:hypothetical protein [Oscillospiraceae bacterium]